MDRWIGIGLGPLALLVGLVAMATAAHGKPVTPDETSAPWTQADPGPGYPAERIDRRLAEWDLPPAGLTAADFVTAHTAPSGHVAVAEPAGWRLDLWELTDAGWVRTDRIELAESADRLRRPVGRLLPADTNRPTRVVLTRESVRLAPVGPPSGSAPGDWAGWIGVADAAAAGAVYYPPGAVFETWAAPAQPTPILMVENARAGPNPFNPRETNTQIFFDLNLAADVTVEVWDWTGDFVDRVFTGPGTVGGNVVAWGGQTEDGRKLGNGTYFARIVADSGPRREEAVVKVVVWNE